MAYPAGFLSAAAALTAENGRTGAAGIFRYTAEDVLSASFLEYLCRNTGCLERRANPMSTTPITVRGYVAVLPRTIETHQSRVAIIQDDQEYRVLTKGAGVDLIDDVNAPIEAVGTVEEIDGDKYITVRKYKLLEDEHSWDEDDEG